MNNPNRQEELKKFWDEMSEENKTTIPEGVTDKVREELERSVQKTITAQESSR